MPSIEFKVVCYALHGMLCCVIKGSMGAVLTDLALASCERTRIQIGESHAHDWCSRWWILARCPCHSVHRVVQCVQAESVMRGRPHKKGRAVPSR